MVIGVARLHELVGRDKLAPPYFSDFPYPDFSLIALDSTAFSLAFFRFALAAFLSSAICLRCSGVSRASILALRSFFNASSRAFSLRLSGPYSL